VLRGFVARATPAAAAMPPHAHGAEEEEVIGESALRAPPPTALSCACARARRATPL